MTPFSASYPSLTGKVVLITGGASGIGETLVRRFLQQGARTAFIDIDAAAAQALIDALAAEGLARPWFRTVDVSDVPALQAAVAQVHADHGGRLDVLVNNAGLDTRIPAETLTVADFDRLVAVNLRSQVFALQAAAALMTSGGSIINMGSVTWRRRRPGMVAYTVSKAGIHGMTRSLAQEFGGRGIRINSVAPGAIATPRQDRLWANPDAVNEFIDSQALKFRLTPDDVAAMTLFLAADDSRGCSGQDFIVDGGIS
jgi:NAD(P)-dependent dehydrogenase (short-subunit alcohol dehydrogenase family)